MDNECSTFTSCKLMKFMKKKSCCSNWWHSRVSVFFLLSLPDEQCNRNCNYVLGIFYRLLPCQHLEIVIEEHLRLLCILCGNQLGSCFYHIVCSCIDIIHRSIWLLQVKRNLIASGAKGLWCTANLFPSFPSF